MTAVKVLAGSSTSISESLPVVTEGPDAALATAALATPPNSTDVPVVVPEMIAASSAPLMLIVKAC
ncbi:hypothetical protein ACQ5SK_02275 [Bradyrhizobium japonicum]